MPYLSVTTKYRIPMTDRSKIYKLVCGECGENCMDHTYRKFKNSWVQHKTQIINDSNFNAYIKKEDYKNFQHKFILLHDHNNQRLNYKLKANGNILYLLIKTYNNYDGIYCYAYIQI